MHHSIFLILLLPFALTNAQFYFHQPAAAVKYAPYQPQGQPATVQSQYAHRAVVENAARESQLPPELQKSSRFYSNPHIAAALAKESWFTDKEMPVVDREAEKIPRDMVFKIFRNAGWIKRR